MQKPVGGGLGVCNLASYRGVQMGRPVLNPHGPRDIPTNPPVDIKQFMIQRACIWAPHDV